MDEVEEDEVGGRQEFKLHWKCNGKSLLRFSR